MKELTRFTKVAIKSLRLPSVCADSKRRECLAPKHLQNDAIDFGPSTAELCEYPNYAAKVTRAVSNAEGDRAILIGVTGIGMSIVANKIRYLQDELCHDDLSVEIRPRYNDADILCQSVDLLDGEVSCAMIKFWWSAPFKGGHHIRRVAENEQSIQKLCGLRNSTFHGKTIRIVDRLPTELKKGSA